MRAEEGDWDEGVEGDWSTNDLCKEFIWSLHRDHQIHLGSELRLYHCDWIPIALKWLSLQTWNLRETDTDRPKDRFCLEGVPLFEFSSFVTTICVCKACWFYWMDHSQRRIIRFHLFQPIISTKISNERSERGGKQMNKAGYMAILVAPSLLFTLLVASAKQRWRILLEIDFTTTSP